jgi:hypothetical protein
VGYRPNVLGFAAPWKPAARTVAQLKQVLQNLGLLRPDEDVTYERCYHGWWQRSAGAWSWCAYVPCAQPAGRVRDVTGSVYPLREVLAAARKGLVTVYRERPWGEPELMIEPEYYRGKEIGNGPTA